MEVDYKLINRCADCSIADTTYTSSIRSQLEQFFSAIQLYNEEDSY
jgi:Fe-S cluster biogenesis protein NfuA